MYISSNCYFTVQRLNVCFAGPVSLCRVKFSTGSHSANRPDTSTYNRIKYSVLS